MPYFGHGKPLAAKDRAIPARGARHRRAGNLHLARPHPASPYPASPTPLVPAPLVPLPAVPAPKEIGGPTGPEPTRYGDWEYNGRCTDF